MTDMIDLATINILNSPDVHAWPATTEITKLSLQPTGVHVEFTKQEGPDRWPDFPFGEGPTQGTLQFTLWIVLNIAGQWCAAGCIEFWYGLYENGGPVDGYAKNWYYDLNRWGLMTGHQPAPGERVGFFITSGDARHGYVDVGLHERSNIVAIDFPGTAGWNYTFNHLPEPPVPLPPPALPPVPLTPPTPVQPPVSDLPDPRHELLSDVLTAVERIVEAVEQLARAAVAIEGQIEQANKSGIRFHL